MVNLGIVILTKGNLDYLFRCVHSIITHTKKVDYTIYIVDTGSTPDERDATCEFIKDRFKHTKNCKFYNLDYYNFARCNNFIIDGAVKEDYLLLCNNDIELLDDSIDVLMERMHDDDKIGTVGCRLEYPDSGNIQHAGQFCKVGGGRYIQSNQVQAHLLIGHRGQHTRNKYSDWEPIMGNTAGYMLVRRDIFYNAGGLNESYVECFEDVEFNWSVLRGGYHNMYCDTVKCIHFESLSRGVNWPAIHRDWAQQLIPYFNSLSLDMKRKVVSLTKDLELQT